jgi:uncharacterized protein (DUF1800 family)
MFGVRESQFTQAQGLGSMSAVVNKLLAAVTLPTPPSWVVNYPDFADATTLDEQMNLVALEANRIQQLENWWFDIMMQENLSILQKMTLMWTNHFVTGSQTTLLSSYVYTYLNTCMTNALGNFQTFALAISQDPNMLVYLNGNENYVFGGQSFVNENYARELMELFTLGLNDPITGKPNYTESDVQNSARALTGWQPSTTSPFVGQFNPSLHDTTNKTFLGQTGNWALSDIIKIIFEQGTPAGYTSAYWACQKIYKEFVYYVPNASVVDAMATLMLQNNFEIAPVMEALLSSEHFYDASVIGAQIKSPIEYFGSLVREFDMTYPPFSTDDPKVVSTTNGLNTYLDPNPTLSILTYLSNLMGQELLNPPNVAGWPGGESWLSAGTFANREEYSYAILNNGLVNSTNNWNLPFNPDTYALQINNANTLSSSALSSALENLSLAFTLGTHEGGDLDTDIQGTYPNPNYQYNTLGVSNFANYMASLPEFQLF